MMTISKELTEEILEQLKGAQNDYYVKDTQDVIDKLETIIKNCSIRDVSQQRELFDAILDFTEDLPMCSEDYNRDTLYKRYIAENCG